MSSDVSFSLGTSGTLKSFNRALATLSNTQTKGLRTRPITCMGTDTRMALRSGLFIARRLGSRSESSTTAQVMSKKEHTKPSCAALSGERKYSKAVAK